MSSLSTLIALLLLFPLWYLSSLPHNYILARRTGLPIVLSPVNPANPLWLVFAATYQPLLARYLPGCVYRRLRLAVFGWEFREREGVGGGLGNGESGNGEWGRGFVLVTSGGNEVWVVEPGMAIRVLGEWRGFGQMGMSSSGFLLLWFRDLVFSSVFVLGL